eukprot:XP_011602371.1 PREDICTED: acyl-CoA synthetase family member 2, mitochondrial-like [Takifugu rubripes]
MAPLSSPSLLRCCRTSVNTFGRFWRLQRSNAPLGLRSIHVDGPPSVPSLTTSYVHGTSSVSLLYQTVGQRLDSTVQRWPDREAVVCVQDGIRKTFSQFQQDVDKVAAGLLALGLKPGDRLGVWGPNMYEWILFQFATAKAGIILVSLNTAYQANEVDLALKKVQCNAVVCPTSFRSQKYCEMLREICPEIGTTPAAMIKSSRLPDLKMVIVTDSRQPGMLHVEDVMQAAESRHHRELLELQSKLSCDGPINIQFTSGTTGSPKGATLSHHNIVNNAYFIGLRNNYNSRYDLSSVEAGIIGGSPCPQEIMRKLIRKISMKELVVVYGTTENSPATFLGFPQDREDLKTNTVGCIMDHTEAKVVDPVTGQTVPLGTSGELMIRGYCVMKGYWNDPVKTSEAITDGQWYKTGDTASLNSLGYCQIEGRIKDLIIRGGENIYPAEIEQFLFQHPKIQEVQVVGVKDERLGEQVCACIRLKNGQSSSPEEIKAFCKGQVRLGQVKRGCWHILWADVCLFFSRSLTLRSPTMWCLWTATP